MKKNTKLIDLFIEPEILKHKSFFKEHFLKLKNIDYLANQVDRLKAEMSHNQPKSVFIKNIEHETLTIKVETFLKENFNPHILEIYNKEIPTKTVLKKSDEEYNNILLKIISELSYTFNNINEQFKKEWEYKINYMNFLYSCLKNYGLSPNILKRDSRYKRFNIQVVHYHNTKSRKKDFRSLMKYEDFDREILNQYKALLPIKAGGKLIPFEKIDSVRITTTLLLDDEIELFALKNGFSWNDKTKNENKFINCCLDETDIYHPNPFLEPTSKNHENNILFEEVKSILKCNPKSLKLYNNALSKLNNSDFERNLIDDLRLSLEIFLQEILKNNKSLENQTKEIGKFQKVEGAPKEVTNMFIKLLEYYTKYQNEYVKHDDKVSKNDINFIIEITSIFIKYIGN